MLTDVVISEGVESIERHAFCGCSSLTDVVIPKTVTYLGEHAFEDCLNPTNQVQLIEKKRSDNLANRNRTKGKKQSKRKKQKETYDYPTLFDQDFVKKEEEKDDNGDNMLPF